MKKQIFMFICLMLIGTTLFLPIGCGPTATNTSSNSGCDTNCSGSDGNCYKCGSGGVCSKADVGNCSAAVAGVRCCYGGGAPVAAGVTDSNGKVTLSSNGVTIPVKLTDQNTGAPLVGVAVGLGNDPTMPGGAVLLIAQASQKYPLQIILLESASAPASFVEQQNKQGDSSTLSVGVQSGCPTKSGITDTRAIAVPNIPFPAGATHPNPVSVAQWLVNAGNGLLAHVPPGSLPPGFTGPIAIQQYTGTMSAWKSDLINIIQRHGAAHVFMALIATLYPNPINMAIHHAGLAALTPELVMAAVDAYYGDQTTGKYSMQEMCWGSYCIEVPLSLKTAPTSYPVNLSVLPVDASGESLYNSSKVLGMTEVGPINNGTGTVNVPAGPNTVCVNSPGYAQYVREGFIVSAPGTPLNVTLTPNPTKYSCSGNSCVVNAGGSYSTSNCNNECGGGTCTVGAACGTGHTCRACPNGVANKCCQSGWVCCDGMIGVDCMSEYFCNQ